MSFPSDAAKYLAAAGAVLVRFDPETSLQAIADLAVPTLADWCFIHLATPATVETVAIAHHDREVLAATRDRMSPFTPRPETSVARVLAGGAPELVQLDDEILARAALSPAHLEELRARGYRSSVTAPLAGRDSVLGAITFAMAHSGRTYDEAHLAMLTELANRTGLALENARLFAAERQAHERARRLQELTVALASVVEQPRVVEIFVDAGRAALRAGAGFAWLLRDEQTLELAAAAHDGRAPSVSQFRTIAMSAPLPVCDSVRTMQPLLFESFAAISASYPAAANPSPFCAWAVLPFVVRGGGVGAASFSFDHEREFSAGDRELLAAMTHQASLALERCALVDAERRARSDAEASRQRERQLHVLAARLSSALTRQQIAEIVCEEAIGVLGAYAASASLVVGHDMLTLGTAGPIDQDIAVGFVKIPIATVVPSAEAARSARLVWCAGETELLARYAHLEHIWRAWGIYSWGAVPFTFEGRTIGSLGIAFVDTRELAIDDRELLHAIGQLTAQALERARLYEAHQASEEQLRIALVAARAATWSLDLSTMASRRDANYQLLVGPEQAGTVQADFMSIHPDDRAIAQAAFERTLADGTPYEPVVRIRRDDGSYLWIQAHGRLTHDAAGKPIVLAGVIIDIDETKRASLRAEEERRINDTMQRLAGSFTSELDHDRLVQLITDEIAKLVGAETGGFDASDAAGGQLIVPLTARSGEQYGRLQFGHSDANHFTEDHLGIATRIATHATIALENARLYKQARLADRRKDEFLAMLGHELRNPLAPIATALELLNLKGTEDTRRERDVLRRQVTHLRRLIDDLLDVSRLTRGTISLTREVIELAEVMSRAIEMASPLLEKRHQHLTVDIARGLLVDADPTRLAQVFHNLLTNASKYSDPSSEIEVRATVTGGRASVAVRDRGIGMAAELVANVFGLFSQGERSLARTDGGLGIGLTVAKSLTELHGGSIEAVSDGAGRGSTFTVTLPLAVQLVPSAPLSPEGSAPGARVLVVDDNVDAAAMLRESLAAYGHELAIAHDGPAALELAASFKPDIAVLDIGLPVMNGYELARQLRARLGAEKLRLIAVTGYGEDADHAQSREVGFDDHLIKPIEITTLLDLLAGQTDRRR